MFQIMLLKQEARVTSSKYRVTTDLENIKNLESSGNLKNGQNFRENSGKFEFLWKNLENSMKM